MTDKLEITKREQVPQEPVDSDYVLNPSEEVLRDLGERLRERFGQLKDVRERSDWEKEKAEAFESYHMKEIQRDLPWQGASNLTCWIPRMAVDSIHAFRMQSIFGNGRKAKVRVTRYPKDSAAMARRAADYMTYILEHESKFYRPMDDADLNAETYGVGYLEPHYVREKVMETVVIEKETVTPEVNPQTGTVEVKTKKEKKTEKRERTVFDGTRIESIPIEAVYISPFVDTIDEAVRSDMVFKVFALTMDQIKDRTQGDKPVYRKEFYERIKSVATKSALAKISDLERARQTLDGFYLDRFIGQESISLAMAHLWYDIDEDGKKEKITVTFEIDSGTIAKVSLSKCRIVDLNPHPVDGRFWGEGAYKILRQFCQHWEAINNTRVNAGQWENTPFGFYRAGGRFNPQTITVTPGQFYPVDNPQEIAFAQTPSVRMSYFQEEQMMMLYVEKLIGLPEPIIPPKTKQGSATANIRDTQISGVRFANPLNRVLMSVKELLGHIWELNRECAPKEKEFFIVGADNTLVFDKISRDAYIADMQFELDIDTMFDQQMARDTALLVWRLFRQSPNFQMHPQAGWELDTKVLSALNFDIAIPKPPQSKVKSPFEEHQMFLQDKNVDPVVGEDYDEHLVQHMAILNSDEMKRWEPDQIQRLILHIDKTQILKKIIEGSNLNQSGMPNMPPGMAGPQNGNGKGPQVTASRNPSQTMNTLRVGESPGSMRGNNGNAGIS